MGHGFNIMLSKENYSNIIFNEPLTIMGVDQLEALCLVGPVAAVLGWTGKQTREALQYIMDTGIEGVDAGLSLRMFLSRLSGRLPPLLLKYDILSDDVDPRTHTLDEMLTALSCMEKEDFFGLVGQRAGNVFWRIIEHRKRME